jgi:hypothetical protein
MIRIGTDYTGQLTALKKNCSGAQHVKAPLSQKTLQKVEVQWTKLYLKNTQDQC